MSDRVHTTDEIREFVTYGDWGTQEYPGEWFDAWLKSHDAAVERAAAEKAWQEGAEAAFYDPYIRGFIDYPENPYGEGKE